MGEISATTSAPFTAGLSGGVAARVQQKGDRERTAPSAGAQGPSLPPFGPPAAAPGRGQWVGHSPKMQKRHRHTVHTRTAVSPAHRSSHPHPRTQAHTCALRRSQPACTLNTRSPVSLADFHVHTQPRSHTLPHTTVSDTSRLHNTCAHAHTPITHPHTPPGTLALTWSHTHTHACRPGPCPGGHMLSVPSGARRPLTPAWAIPRPPAAQRRDRGRAGGLTHLHVLQGQVLPAASSVSRKQRPFTRDQAEDAQDGRHGGTDAEADVVAGERCTCV